MDETTRNLYRLNELIVDAERVLNDVLSQTQRLPIPKDASASSEYAMYTDELRIRAVAWQRETEHLRQLLSDHPALVVPPANSVQPAISDVQLLDLTYTRMQLNDTWMHLSPIAFAHRGSIFQMVRPSFREIYRVILHDLSTVFADTFVMRCKVLQRTNHLPMTEYAHVYNFAVFRYENYFFNIQLPADKIRQFIVGLYDVFALPQREFVVWVKR